MALQAGVQTSKVLILVGAGLSGSIMLRHGRLSELIAQLQELLQGTEGVDISSYKYDSAQLAAQIRQIAKEIKELSLSNPITIFNGNSNSSGSYASYLVPAAALGAMGYCYMWWKGWSFSDVMFVTKKNMASAVTAVSRQLDDLSETLASTRRHLSKRLETLDFKVEEQHETSNLILSNVGEMKSNLSQIGFDVQTIHEMISGIEGKIELLESKQDVTISGLWHLCQVADGVKSGTGTKAFQDFGSPLPIESKGAPDNSLEGLRFLTEEGETNEPSEEKAVKQSEEKTPATTVTRRVHRSFTSGISWVRNVT
ncbi:PREDICTED: uncharacterized protein LOC104801014 [Tarenaya hassleriana]|uniref:uncharacterized protein LOC104801014 n=1 Tax=Tarenaya hassleriana TaxID=28532 RepID=UPI00053C5233|nr:PREDICTED: uncharacterized protein LOC104801014 [Tarenaya hassleriana]